MKLTLEVASETFCMQTLSNFSRSDPFETETTLKCVGSDCMAWRWCAEPKDVDDQVGYCGLAGKPEI